MAAFWQIYFYVVPDSVLRNEPVSLKWETKEILPYCDTYFRKDLWKNKGIKENIIQYGNINETCVEIFCIDDKCEMMVTMDLRQVKETFIDSLCEFCLYKEAVILSPDGKITKATNRNLINMIIYSEAARFCMYVEPYLAKIRDETDYNRKHWWEYRIPEEKKLRNLSEIEKIIKEYAEKIRNL